MAQQRRRASGARRPGSRIPTFKSIEEEAEFWDTHSTAEFEDEFEETPDVRFVGVGTRPKRALTVRVDEDTFSPLSKEARDLGIGSSTLVRMWILERLREQESRQRSAP